MGSAHTEGITIDSRVSLWPWDSGWGSLISGRSFQRKHTQLSKISASAMVTIFRCSVYSETQVIFMHICNQTTTGNNIINSHAQVTIIICPNVFFILVSPCIFYNSLFKKTNKMHLTFNFIIYSSTPTYVSVLFKTIFRGFKNYVHSTSNVTSDKEIAQV
jgi:hypothetical protein